MNDQQIKIGDKLLELFVDHDGKMTESTYLPLLNKYFDTTNNVLINTTTIIMIEDYGLIRRGVTDRGIKIITADGYKAAKIGLRQFIIEFEEQKQLEKENLKANIKTAKLAEKNARYSLTISILALITSAFTPFLASRCDNNTCDNNTKNHSANYSKEKIENRESRNNINVSDSINVFK